MIDRRVSINGNYGMSLKIILAGIFGTALMTLFMYMLSLVTHDRFKVVKILGTMLTFQTTHSKGLSDRPSAIMVGTLTHYLIGIGFAFIYSWLWSTNIVEKNFFEITVLGFVNGMVGAAGWKIFISIHPNPPNLRLRSYLLAIVLGHVFFAVGVLATYLFLADLL